MIYLADDLPNPLPIRQVRMKSNFPRRKIYSSGTVGQHSFRALLCRVVFYWRLNCSNNNLNCSKILLQGFYMNVFGQSSKIINLIITTQSDLTTELKHNAMHVDVFLLSCLECAGCGEDIRSGQSLLALEKQWHLWCFTCTKCGCLLSGEYMGRSVY